VFPVRIERDVVGRHEERHAAPSIDLDRRQLER
jgi:hypothetical protein